MTSERLFSDIIKGSLCLPALGLRGELGDLFLVEAAHLPGPLGALGVGGVARGLVLALLLQLSPTLSHIILESRARTWRPSMSCQSIHSKRINQVYHKREH